MSVVMEAAVESTPAVPVPVAPEAAIPVPVTPAAPESLPASEELSIADYNKAVEAALSEEDIASPVAVEEEAEETPVVEEPETVEEPAVAEAAPASEFKLDADTPFEEFTAQKAAYLETVEVTPELQAILDRQEAEIAKASTGLGEFNAETLTKVGSALNRLFETEIDTGGGIKVNAEPLIELLRTDYKDEFRPIMEQGLGSDSQKYQGASLLEEILIDQFGSDKASKMVAFGMTNTPLPVTPSALQLPQGIEERNKEAYWKLPEVKRFQIQSLVDDINELQADMADATDYRKEEIAKDLRDKREILDTEYYAVDQIQRGIDGDRERQTVTQRQNADNLVRFRNQVNTEYNNELFTLADTFAQDLAPRLTYADGDTQLSQARNIMSRVNNALAFTIGTDGAVTADPMSEHYAKQLTEEGVKFDFGKGRDLLQSHYKATEKLEALKLRHANPQHIELATKERNRIMFDIKTEQRVLLGQLSTKYVTSNGNALKNQIAAVTAKKQAVRSVTSNKSHTDRPSLDPAKEIAEYNRQVAAATGEELFDSYQQ